MTNIFSKISKVEIREIHLNILKQKNVQLFLQRDDLLHHEVSGNKWRKLKYVLSDFDRTQYKGIISFGGQFSNHLAAVSAACRMLKIPFVAFVRGYDTGVLNPSIEKLINDGTKIHRCSNEDFRELRDCNWLNPDRDAYPNHLVIPEGGSGALALKSCSEISKYWIENYDYACSSIGTGTTFSGMVNGLPPGVKGLGFVMLKDRGYLTNEISTMIHSNTDYSLNREYHFNGFGKVNDELIFFMNDFYEKTEIKLDPIYTGKLLYGIIDMVKNNYFKKGSKIIAIHTGGVQGVNGMNERLKRKNKPCLNYDY